uniref:Uncharacterized protein n=1 Tax=Lepeophtheirus salmonis TaxID=72036 RepID=A0A0K2U2K5_LEPSM
MGWSLVRKVSFHPSTSGPFWTRVLAYHPAGTRRSCPGICSRPTVTISPPLVSCQRPKVCGPKFIGHVQVAFSQLLRHLGRSSFSFSV